MRADTRTRLPLLAACGFALLFAGCKDKPTTGGIARNDPLLGGNRIPPQNVPVPDRGTAGNKSKPFDPLMTPVGSKDTKSGAGYTDDPQRWKGRPYSPNMGSVPASLAGRGKDGDELKIEDPTRGVPLQPAGGPIPAGDADLAASADLQLQQLREYGVAKGNYSFTRENGSVVFRANVPSPTGATQGFTGVGANPAEAVKQVLDQVKANRGK